jgi:Ca2+/Na+ antiporter
MIKNHIVMQINAAMLILIGLWGFYSSGSPTALIAPATGIILLILSFPTKNEKHVAAHIAVILTLIISVAFLVIGFRRANTLVIIMGVISLLCFGVYLLNFFIRKKQRNENKTGA